MTDHLVGVADGAQAVGDHEAGAALHQAQQRLLDARLGAGVDAAGGLVQDQDGRVGQDGAGDGKQLALALAEVAGPLRELGLVAVRQLADEVVGVGQLGRLDHFLVGGLQPAVADVLHHGVGEQEGVLQHQPQLAAQVGLA